MTRYDRGERGYGWATRAGAIAVVNRTGDFRVIDPPDRPSVPVKRVETNNRDYVETVTFWVIDCPWCGREHRHSAEPGHRVAHCHRGDGYVLYEQGGAR